LDIEKWYEVSYQDVASKKGGVHILKHHNGSHTRALMNLFPELDFDPKLFVDISRRSRREFFDKIAENMGFDPLDASRWYGISARELLSRGNATRVLRHHGSSHIKALVDLYPELNLVASKFKNVPRNSWEDSQKRRDFFVKFANENGFNALQADGWYGVTSKDILRFKGGSRVLVYHQVSHIKALQDLFPELGIDPLKFSTIPPGTWQQAERRREFFKQICLRLKLNPLLPSSWYQISRGHVQRKKGGARILEYHNRSHVEAMMELFPDLNLQKNKFLRPY